MGENRRQRREREAAEKLAKQRNRQAKAAITPTLSRVPKVEIDPNDANANTVLWSFACFDPHDWRVNLDSHASFCDIASRLQEYSGRTWGEILKDQVRDHSCELTSLAPVAQKRLTELGMDDAEVIWRFRFDGTQRLWGFRQGAHLVVLWWDPDHQVYPSTLKHT